MSLKRFLAMADPSTKGCVTQPNEINPLSVALRNHSIEETVMPMIEVTAPENALDKPTRDRLMKRLTDTLLKWEGAPIGSAAAQAIAWTYYHEIPDGFFYVGGAN